MRADWVFSKKLGPREAKKSITSSFEIPKCKVIEHFDTLLLQSEKVTLNHGGIVHVSVHDADTGNLITMPLQNSERPDVMLLGEGIWGDAFVATKNLKKGDTVELHLYNSLGMLEFKN
ncbi:hypothetical protein Ancab_029523 [Ancistrocladus abbreviatus]